MFIPASSRIIRPAPAAYIRAFSIRRGEIAVSIKTNTAIPSTPPATNSRFRISPVMMPARNARRRVMPVSSPRSSSKINPISAAAQGVWLFSVTA